MRATTCTGIALLLLLLSCGIARGAEQDYLVAVSNERSNDVTLIDGATKKAVATIPVGKRPRGIQASRDGKLLYVALSGSPIEGPPGERGRVKPPASAPVLPDRAADGIGVVDVPARKLLKLMPAGLDP